MWAGWYVDNSRAASRIGGPDKYGPFPTRAAAEEFCRANNVGMTVIPGGSDDGGASGGETPYNGPNLWQILRERKEKKIEQQRLQLAQEAWNANHEGVEFAKKEDWANAIAAYEESLRKNADDDIVKKNLAQAKARFANYRGTNAYHKGDWATAIAFFKEALAVNPYPENTSVYQDNLNLAEASLQNEQHQKADKVAAAGMQAAIQNFTQTLRAPPKVPTLTAGGLDFDGGSSGTAPGGLDFISGPPTPAPAIPVPGDLRDAPTAPPVPARGYGPPSAVGRAIDGVFADAPEGVADRVRKGFQAVATRDWKVAIAWFEDALNRDPGNPALQGLLEAARSNAQRPTDPEREDALALYRQAWDAVADGNRAGAIIAFDQAMKKDSQAPAWVDTYVSYLRTTIAPQLQLPAAEDAELLFGPLPPRHYTLDANGQPKEVPPNTNQEAGLFVKGPDGQLIQVPEPKHAEFPSVPPPLKNSFWQQWLETLEQGAPPVKKLPNAAVTSVPG
jgi:tetratricopeptide (TPR) repeat protein